MARPMMRTARVSSGPPMVIGAYLGLDESNCVRRTAPSTSCGWLTRLMVTLSVLFLKFSKNRCTSLFMHQNGCKTEEGGSTMKTRQIIAAIRRLLESANARQLELILRIVKAILK